MGASGKSAQIAAAGLFVCLAGLLAALAALSHGPFAPVWRFVAIAVAAHAPYAAIRVLARRGFRPRAIAVIAAAAILRLVLASGHPVFSDDVYRYRWDGRVVAAGLDPYAHPPEAEDLAAFRDADFARINNTELRTIYPPLAELAFGAIASIRPTVSAFQIAAASADLAIVLLLMAVARRRADPSDASAAGFAGLAYGLNPLACIESAMSGHLEPLAVLPVVGAIALLLGARDAKLSIRARRIGAAVSLAAACCVKLVPILLVAPLVRRMRAAILIVPVALIGVYAASLTPDLGAVRTLDTFARRWEANAGAFAAIREASAGIIGAAAGAKSPDEMVHVRFLDGPARALEGGFFSLHKDGGFDPERPGAFALSDLALAVAKIIVAVLLAAAITWTCRRRIEPPEAALWIFGAFLVLTPVLHPWYFLWILPWAACQRSWPWLAFGAVLPLAYLPLDGWWARGSWDAPAWIPIVEYGVLLAAALAARVARRGNADPVDRQRG
jgi:hypothetical protein